MILIRRSNLFKPIHGLGINWGHPLASNLVAAWLCNEGAGSSAISLVNANDVLTLSGGAVWAGVNDRGGIAISMPPSGNPRADLTTPSAALKPTDMVSLFWGGSLAGNENGFDNPALATMTFTNSNTSPFYSYGITRVSGFHDNLFYVDDVGGTLHTPSVNVGLTGLTGRFISAGISIRSGAQVGYFNGSQVTSAANTGSLSYGTPAFRVNSTVAAAASEWANSNPTAIYIWHRVLTPSEFQWLHVDPFALVDVRSPRTKFYFGTTPPAAGFLPWQDFQIPQLLPQ